MKIQLSAIDEGRFGIRSARVSSVTSEDLPTILEECRSHQVVFLIARCPSDDLPAVQAMEQEGFLLMDSQVTYSHSLPTPSVATEGVVLRPVRPDEAEVVSALAAAAFRSYGGHYHADTRLNRARCEEVYPSWAYRSCVSREVADEVLVAERDHQLAGFVTLKMNDDLEGDVPLYGVHPAMQRQQVGRSLISGALDWFQTRGAERMMISTQITNLSSQKVWIRLGFEPSAHFYTFHKWFD